MKKYFTGWAFVSFNTAENRNDVIERYKEAEVIWEKSEKCIY